ncbi:MAG: 2-oxoglutarate dehydrogenase complex dihydrolipoyllysine-residue succinyltransferase [Leptospiraceae bacterium]|nr:2-oxoglutarate dehydrogenase complex dihydrolipoyllysine-residue succinyltransferase [Leptospiraceae bacterium]MDW8306462.1 2-oxoglutarate dehydrogenase complex dihydrolipoyllysine-residue succinyltransferase [Leptospiraceae bacterium]
MAELAEVIVPMMGESITEGTISRWFKKLGDFVRSDEPLFEIETDKVTQEVPSPVTGQVAEIRKKEGDTAKVQEVVAIIEVKPLEASSSSKTPELKKQESHLKEPLKQERRAEERLSPAARKIVAEEGIDVAQVKGTGRDGRITKGDVVAHLEQRSAYPSPMESQRERVVPMSRLRRAIAERLVEAQHTAAILTTFNEIDMQAVMDFRAKYNEAFQKKYGVKLGFMSFFVKAVVAALKEIPAVNAEIRGDNIVYKNYYDIGVAVGGPRGLVVPVVRNADKLSFAEIEMEIARLAQKVHEGTISLAELEGGTFTISNGGIYGSMMSTPILNPPQSGILGMHNIVKRPVVVNDQIVIRPMMYVALSYDHRIIDGKEAVTFLVRVKQAIEDPLRLLVEI